MKISSRFRQIHPRFIAVCLHRECEILHGMLREPDATLIFSDGAEGDARMRLRLAVAADYANLSSEGKLNIMGVFHEITPAGFPAALSQGFLVLEWEAGPAEVGTQRNIRIAFTDPDGTEKVSASVQVEIPKATRPGSPALFNQIINVAGTPLERSGEHAFYILADNDEKGRVTLYVHEPSEGGVVNG